ncbi:MAG: hypothetical protein M1833_003523 [Piccolia ochrophora]|nr:MAG: hypothetical protein M1833_003523 [Piccolia ochrophora]
MTNYVEPMSLSFTTYFEEKSTTTFFADRRMQSYNLVWVRMLLILGMSFTPVTWSIPGVGPSKPDFSTLEAELLAGYTPTAAEDYFARIPWEDRVMDPKVLEYYDTESPPRTSGYEMTWDGDKVLETTQRMEEPLWKVIERKTKRSLQFFCRSHRFLGVYKTYTRHLPIYRFTLKWWVWKGGPPVSFELWLLYTDSIPDEHTLYHSKGSTSTGGVIDFVLAETNRFNDRLKPRMYAKFATTHVDRNAAVQLQVIRTTDAEEAFKEIGLPMLCAPTDSPEISHRKQATWKDIERIRKGERIWI